MVWLTWRQHRAEALGGLLALAAVAAILLAVGLPAHHAYGNNGVATCAAQLHTSQSCSDVIRQFTVRYYNGVATLIGWLNFLPAFIGVFVGAPLLAREFEQGTWRLAWTQAVPRTRWLAVKLVLLVAAVVALAAALTALFTWYRSPFDQLQGRMGAGAFDFEGLAIFAYMLFAFGLGTLAGVLIRRTVVAMAATLGGFIAVRLPVELLLRPHYQHPVTLISDSPDNTGVARTGFEISHNMVDSSGRVLTDFQESHVLNTVPRSVHDPRTWLTAHGYHWREVFQPASRFWHFQLTEAAIFIGLAAILLASAVWLLRRRIG